MGSLGLARKEDADDEVEDGHGDGDPAPWPLAGFSDDLGAGSEEEDPRKNQAKACDGEGCESARCGFSGVCGLEVDESDARFDENHERLQQGGRRR
ncbi:MAG: hypothetical protein RLZZ245_323 [Verrucomicrobiota bacterium]